VAAKRLLGEMEVPDDPETLQVWVRVAIDGEDWSEARQYVRRLRTAGDTVAANMLEAEVYLRTNKASRAEPKVELAVNEAGHALRARAAAVYLDVGLAADGERLLREWVDQEPDNVTAHFQLGTYLYQDDRLDESETEMREVFRLNADHAQALNFLGYSYAERGVKLDEALALIDRAVSLDTWNGAYLDSLGWVYYQMGRYDDAREPLEQATRTYPHDPTVLEHLGDLYAKMGERDLAIAAWSRAIDAGSEDPAGLGIKIGVIEVAEQEGEAGGQTAKPGPEKDPAPWTDPTRWP
jgi:tetratricopeptide (TPR) repeat protein